MLYFIRAKATKLVKIGYTENRVSFTKRLRNLQGANADTLEVIGCIRGGRSVEKAWHENNKADHHHNEWFTASPKLMARIRRSLKDKTRVIHVRV